MSELGLVTTRTKANPGLVEWLFRPFTYLAGARALGLGIAAILLAGLLASVGNTHFDGVLDVHTGRAAPAWFFLSEGFIAWLSLAVILFALGKLTSRSAFRAVDLFGTQAMARWPMVITALAVLTPPYQRFITAVAREPATLAGLTALPLSDIIVGVLVLIVMLAMLVWMVALMYQSYRVCCCPRGAKGIITFVIGLLIAETLSKVGILTLLSRGGLL